MTSPSGGLTSGGAMKRRVGKAIAVMLKAPEPGLVKTRLVPPLTFAQAARLYECFIRDTFANLMPLEDAGIDVYAACTGRRELITGCLPEGVECFEQEGRGLGARMYNSLRHLFAAGYESAAVVGSDTPDLPADNAVEAFELLAGPVRLVLGPSTDGGFYLLAANGLFEPVFTGINYGTSAVLGETTAKARENKIEFRLAAPWHDMDTVEDLRLLKDNPAAPRSSAFIRSADLSV